MWCENMKSLVECVPNFSEGRDKNKINMITDIVRNFQIYGPQILMGAILIGYFTPISPIWWLMSPFVNFFLLLFAGL